MTDKTETHPEFRRAKRVIEGAVAQLDVESGDLRSFSAAMLTMSAELYRLVHGSTGPDGFEGAAAKLLSAHAARDAEQAEFRRFGPGGRA